MRSGRGPGQVEVDRKCRYGGRENREEVRVNIVHGIVQRMDDFSRRFFR